jgi:hypothetical protein
MVPLSVLERCTALAASAKAPAIRPWRSIRLLTTSAPSQYGCAIETLDRKNGW